MYFISFFCSFSRQQNKKIPISGDLSCGDCGLWTDGVLLAKALYRQVGENDLPGGRDKRAEMRHVTKREREREVTRDFCEFFGRLRRTVINRWGGGVDEIDRKRRHVSSSSHYTRVIHIRRIHLYDETQFRHMSLPAMGIRGVGLWLIFHCPPPPVTTL